MQLWKGFLFAVAAATLVAAEDDYARPCPCYTATTTVAANNCPAPTTVKRCGPHANCIRLVQTTIPGPNPQCRTTPTVTSYLPCQPTCRQGCGTQLRTITASNACPSVGCYTYTSVPAPPACPGFNDATCIVPMCLTLKTITIPPPNPACPFTPTVTATPSCTASCRGGCGTSTVVVQASATS